MPPPPPQLPKRPREAATAGSRSTSDVTADEASGPRTRRSPLPPPASAADTASVQSGSDADGGNASDGVDSVMDGVALLGLHCATPGSSRPASRVASASPAPASGSGASVGAAAAGLQSAAEAAAFAPPALLAAAITRSTDPGTRMRIEQAADEHAQRLADLREAVADARQLLATQLQNPIRSYGGNDAFWQLLVAEFALHLPFDDMRSGHALGPAFRRKAEAPDERGRPTRGVPELPGLYSLHALRDALRADESLRFTLHCTLEEWKGVLASTRRRWGRFSNDVRAAPGETLLDFDLRLHREARGWRPPGRPLGESFPVPQSVENGAFSPEWIRETLNQKYSGDGALSLRRMQANIVSGSRRFLQHIPEHARPRCESRESIRRFDIFLRCIQMRKKVEDTFSTGRCAVQCDEVTLYKVSWSVSILVATRPDQRREREVLRCSKLPKDAHDRSKTGVHIGGATAAALTTESVPFSQLDFYISDKTASQSSLYLPDALGGGMSAGGDHRGGAYAHLWHTAWSEARNPLLFYVACLSHAASNEVRAVCAAAGKCTRPQLLAHKKARNVEVSGHRFELIELMADVRHAVIHTPGVLEWLCTTEGLERIRSPPGGAETRWTYWCECAVWLGVLTGRWERILTKLLHEWLLAQGSAGLHTDPSARQLGDPVSLSGGALAAKVASLEKQKQRALLTMMTDPSLRVWLGFIAVYGDQSLIPFIKGFTEDDSPGIGFKARRVILERAATLRRFESDALDCKELDGLKLLVENTDGIDAAAAAAIVSQAAKASADYFEEETHQWHGSRANPVLLLFGLMDERGRAVECAKELLGLHATQGRTSIATAMLPHMPKHDKLNATMLAAAIGDAVDGPCVAFQDEFLDQIRILSNSPAMTKLRDLPAAQSLHQLLYRCLAHVPVSNFKSEEAIKTLTNLHKRCRSEEACATRMVAATHRSITEPTTRADFAWAAGEMRDDSATRRLEKEAKRKYILANPLLPVNLQAVTGLEVGGGDGEEEDESDNDEVDEEEDEADGDEEGGGAASSAAAMGMAPNQSGTERQPGWVQLGSTSLAEARRMCSEGTVAKYLAGYAPSGEPTVWLCLITKIRVRVVEVKWLREVEGEDDVYELDPQEWKGWATVRIKLIYDPCSRVKEVTQGGGPRRWSRPRAPPAASEDADAAEEEGAGEAGAAGSSSGAVDEMECEPPSSPPAREQPVLRGTARQRYGSGAVLSDDPREWLNDEQLGRLAICAGDQRCAERPVTTAYPLDGQSFQTGEVFATTRSKEALNSTDRSRLFHFCHGMHWRNAVICAPARSVFFWEPYGSDLRASDRASGRLREAADAACGTRGWSVVILRLRLQDDAFQCGVWASWFRQRFHAWVARGDFQDPLHLFLLRGTPLRDLSGLRGSELRNASRANGVFIAEERLRLRGLLQAYAETGANPFGDAGAFLHDFTDGGEASRRGDGEAREAAILQLLLDAGSAENPIGGPEGL